MIFKTQKAIQQGCLLCFTADVRTIKFHNQVELFMHTEYTVRKHPFKAIVPWDKQSVLKNQKHSLD